MTLPDGINGAFEAIGSLMNFVNCIQLYRDKGFSGVSVWPTVFFAIWGLWNLYYYPSLDQWMSFSGGLLIVASNTAWLAMALYYGRRP